MRPLAANLPLIDYPDDDGEPMADNTLQYEWIVTIKGNLDCLFKDSPNVFVAGNLLWYPVEGNNKIRVAPDALVSFGRPKGRRGSYRQWEEGGIAPQVTIEVLSPGNTPGEMTRKFQFYEKYGVEEYYQYDPDRNTLDGWLRAGSELLPIESMQGWISPRLKVRFDLQLDELIIWHPNGERFQTFEENFEKRDEARSGIEEQKQRADEERQARLQAQSRADAAQQQVTEERQRNEALAAKLRLLGINPDSI